VQWRRWNVLRIVGWELEVGFCFANCGRAGLSVDGGSKAGDRYFF
jgi:hypothetical protein